MTDKEFWEKCGFRMKAWESNPTSYYWEAPAYSFPAIRGELPPIDLTHLFRYRPKNIVAIYFDFELEAGETHVHLIMANGQSYWAISDIDKPEDALKEAIWKALGGKK